MHFCAYHKEEHHESAFRIKNGKLDSWCIEGRREYNRKYSAKKYAPIKENVAARKMQRETCRTKICSQPDCHLAGKEQPLENFSYRKDRPTKLEAKCKPCLKRIIRGYNKTAYDNDDPTARRARQARLREINPEHHRRATRLRRARKATVRSEVYTRLKVWENSNGLCSLCQTPVDLSVKWPDPKFGTIEHIQPISKRGPDIEKNLAIAHLGCNSSKRDRFTFELNSSDWSVQEITFKIARKPVERYHYLHTAAARPTASYGLYNKDRLMGVAIFGACAGPSAAQTICNDHSLVREFNRLWIDDSAPSGAGSWFVSRAFKLLGQKMGPLLIISYADPKVGHTGDIYKALSFHYAGKGSTQKLRFWTAVGSRREKKKLRAVAKWPTLPFEQ